MTRKLSTLLSSSPEALVEDIEEDDEEEVSEQEPDDDDERVNQYEYDWSLMKAFIISKKNSMPTGLKKRF